MSDREVDRLRKQWMQDAGISPPLQLVTLTLSSYSELVRTLGLSQGLLLGAGLSLSSDSTTEWGSKLAVEADRISKSTSRITGN